MKYINIVVIIATLLCINAAHATVWYVHPDSAMNCIQDCLDSCSTGDTVLVGPGTYYENIIWPNTQGINLASELGADTTTIDGNHTTTVISCTTPVNSTTKIVGLTIQHGHAWPSGGIRCFNASPTITNNYILENGDAGIACGGYSSPLIIYNVICNNGPVLGGIYCSDNSSPLIINNMITNNHAGEHGGGIGCWNNSSPTITNNTIASNRTDQIYPTFGGGIYCAGGSTPIITHNTIDDNSTIGRGGGIYCSCDATCIITDNIISNNQASTHYFCAGDGGGIYIVNSCPILTNNIITTNWAEGDGAGLYNRSASPIIESCTISNHTGDGIYCIDSSTPLVNNCNIAGNSCYGIRNMDPDVLVIAENNWWGHATGPYHPTANPGGLGDAVSDYVDFDPWLSIGIEEHDPSKSVSVFLQVSPNPFRHRTQIRYQICDMGYEINNTTLRIYDATGRLVKSFRITPYALRNTLSWDGRDDQNRMLSSGVYFLKLRAGHYIETRKLLFIK